MKNTILTVMSLCSVLFSGCVTNLVKTPGSSAVIVGMSVSQKYGSCVGCDQDVRHMKEIIGNRIEHVTVLENGAANRASVISAFQKAVQKDLAVFYYSGHGGQQSSSDPSETDRRDEYICLNDGPLVDNEIWNIICGAKGRVFLIFDCCHAGTMYRELDFGKCFTRESVTARSKPEVLCWSGCADNQSSYGEDYCGGYLTSTIVSKNRIFTTYDGMWHKISHSQGLIQNQTPVKTELGGNWNRQFLR